MGVRLYPILKDNVSTANFLGYAESVQTRLDELSARKKSGEISMDEFFETLYSADESWADERHVNSFDLNGWGKNLPMWAEDYCGDEKDDSLWKPFIQFEYPEVDVDLMVGVGWF